MNKNILARHSGSADWVKAELKKLTQVTDPKQSGKNKTVYGDKQTCRKF
jgi:hypothetical protein